MSPTQAAVIARLWTADGAFVSGEELARSLGLSRAAVAKAVAGLRKAGYAIESRPRVGHQLREKPDLLLPVAIEAGLATAHFGRTVSYHDAIETTQVAARALAEDGAAHGTLVVAEQQTHGRGRLSRHYVSLRGGVWATLIVRRPFPPPSLSLVSLAAGVAVAEAIRDQADLPVTLKWPNDVLIAGRKVAGTLIELAAEENAIHYLLVGTGINVNFETEALPAELWPIATTIQAEAGHPIDRVRLLQAYLLRFEALCAAILDGEEAAVLDAWKTLPNSLGRRVQVTAGTRTIAGIATGLSDRGALLVDTGVGGVEEIVVGDVTHASAAAR